MGAVNYYAALGVTPQATPDEIRAAYRCLVFACHPDQNQGDVSRVPRFREIVEANSVLSDAAKRRRYDEGVAAAESRRVAEETEMRARAAAAVKARATARPAPSTGPSPLSPWLAVAKIAAILLKATIGEREPLNWDPSVRRFRTSDGRFAGRG